MTEFTGHRIGDLEDGMEASRDAAKAWIRARTGTFGQAPTTDAGATITASSDGDRA
jgi:hypothetical protein